MLALFTLSYTEKVLTVCFIKLVASLENLQLTIINAFDLLSRFTFMVSWPKGPSRLQPKLVQS